MLKWILILPRLPEVFLFRTQCSNMNSDMHPLPAYTLEVIKQLQNHDINPILYGSVAVSLYIGPFKEFGDIDFLVPGDLLTDHWSNFQDTLKTMGFTLLNEREHEFENDSNVKLGFASEDILLRDNIITNIDQIIQLATGSVTIRTLSAGALQLAYKFSKKDGYRKEVRGKKDEAILHLLSSY
jgi:hypothetical protein